MKLTKDPIGHIKNELEEYGSVAAGHIQVLIDALEDWHATFPGKTAQDVVALLEAKTLECDRLRADLLNPPMDVQEKVIQMLNLVSRDALEAKERACEQLRRDKERLDWLDDVLQQGDVDIYSRLNLDSDSVDLRSAIDDAMTKGEGKV